MIKIGSRIFEGKGLKKKTLGLLIHYRFRIQFVHAFISMENIFEIASLNNFKKLTEITTCCCTEFTSSRRPLAERYLIPAQLCTKSVVDGLTSVS